MTAVVTRLIAEDADHAVRARARNRVQVNVAVEDQRRAAQQNPLFQTFKRQSITPSPGALAFRR